MAEDKVKNFNEYLLENVQAVRDETRQFKQDIGKRMDGLEKRMDRIETRMDKLEDKLDKLSDKLDTSLKEIRQLVAESQKDIRNPKRHNDMLTSVVVSAIVTSICCLLIHWKGQ